MHVPAAWVAPDLSSSVVLTTADTVLRGSTIRLSTYDADGSELAVLHEQASTGRADLDAQLWVVGDGPATVALHVVEHAERSLFVGGVDAPLTDVTEGSDVALSSLLDVVADHETGDLVVTYEPGMESKWAGTLLVPGDGDPVFVEYDGQGQGGRPTIVDLVDGEAVVATVERDYASVYVVDGDGRTELGARTDGVGPLTARGIHLDLDGDVILDTEGGLFRCARSGCDELEELPGVALAWSHPPERSATWLVVDGCAPDLIGTGFDQFC